MTAIPTWNKCVYTLMRVHAHTHRLTHSTLLTVSLPFKSWTPVNSLRPAFRVKSSQLGARCHGNLHPLLFQALTAAPSPPSLILGPIIHLCSLPILPDFPPPW